jgi:hypothetical protein
MAYGSIFDRTLRMKPRINDLETTGGDTIRRVLHDVELPLGVFRRWFQELAARGDRLVSVRVKDYLRALRARQAQESSTGEAGLPE